MNVLEAEMRECEVLLAQATQPSLKNLLQTHLFKLQKSAAPLPPPPATSATSTSTSSSSTSASTAAATPAPALASAATRAGGFIPITDFAWEQGAYNSPQITVYVDLPGVGSVKDNVKCTFGKHSLDLVVNGLNGKNYRLINENLEKDIVVAESKCLVKANKVVLKLQKVKGKYSYESWMQLTAKKPRDAQEVTAQHLL